MVTTNANLAETFRPVGANSGFRGCDLPAPPLPSYEKGKNPTNSPDEDGQPPCLICVMSGYRSQFCPVSDQTFDLVAGRAEGKHPHFIRDAGPSPRS